MDEHATVLLVEVLDGAGVRVDLHGSGDGAGELLVGERNLRDLWLEGTGHQGSQESPVPGVAVPAGIGAGVGV